MSSNPTRVVEVERVEGEPVEVVAKQEEGIEENIFKRREGNL